MKKILIIQGHPDPQSYNWALAEAYKKGAVASGAEVQEIKISELSFNPNLVYGYRKRTELEPDLLHAQALITWAEHIVWVYPVWWGSYPALMKGFLDRVFLPGYAFQKQENSLWWDKLLKGRTAHIIATMDQPTWFYRFINGRPSTIALKRLTMQFVGIQSVKTTSIGPVRLSTVEFREKWLKKIENLGKEIR
jgi:NAD(P)H dehydrogenase (quinone)